MAVASDKKKGLGGFLYRTIFFFGWLLSPFTFWNDAFINIPIAYICANLVSGFISLKFSILVIIFYWASNILGLGIMYASTRHLIAGKGSLVSELAKLLLTLCVYSAILIILDRIGILRPIRLSF